MFFTNVYMIKAEIHTFIQFDILTAPHNNKVFITDGQTRDL